MATTIDYTQHFPADPQTVWAMLKDPAYIELKAMRSGAREVNAEVEEAPGETRIVSRRRLPAKLPSFMKKMVGEELVINETQRWDKSSDDGSRSGTFVVDFGGQPLAFSGTVRLQAVGDGTDVVTHGSLKASVRLVGGKVEGVAQEWMVKYLRKEESVAAEWLAEKA